MARFKYDITLQAYTPKKVVISLCILLLNSIYNSALLAQSAKMLSLGGFYDAIEDASHVFRNPACTSFTPSTLVQGTIENKFGLRELTNRSIVILSPISLFQGGFGFSLFGTPSYQSLVYTGALSLKVTSKSNIGIRMAWYQTKVSYSETERLLTPLVGAGWFYKPNNQYFLGLQYSYFSKKINQIVPIHLVPARFSASCSWQPNSEFNYNIGSEVDMDDNIKIRTGLEWRPAKILAVRTGLVGKPTKYFFGLGIYYRSFIVDLSTERHPILGFSNSLSISYVL